MLKINISKTGNGEELRKTLDSLESEGLISSEQSKKITSELDKLIDDLSRNHGKSFRVTCAGVYNSGKSSLLTAETAPATHAVLSSISSIFSARNLPNIQSGQKSAPAK